MITTFNVYLSVAEIYTALDEYLKKRGHKSADKTFNFDINTSVTGVGVHAHPETTLNGVTVSYTPNPTKS